MFSVSGQIYSEEERENEKKLEKIYKTAYAAYGDAYNYYRKQIEKYRNDPSYLEIMEAHKKAAEEAENEKKNLTYTKEEKEKSKLPLILVIVLTVLILVFVSVTIYNNSKSSNASDNIKISDKE